MGGGTTVGLGRVRPDGGTIIGVGEVFSSLLLQCITLTPGVIHILGATEDTTISLKEVITSGADGNIFFTPGWNYAASDSNPDSFLNKSFLLTILSFFVIFNLG